MTMRDRIQSDTKAAMKQRDRTRVGALRMLDAALKNAEIEAGRPDERSGRHPSRPKPRSSALTFPNPSHRMSSKHLSTGPSMRQEQKA